MKNVELLLAAKESILEEPEHFDIRHWVKMPGNYSCGLVGEIPSDFSLCGTTACIAGWVIHHALRSGIRKQTKGRIDTAAKSLLGIRDWQLFYTLFMLAHWPSDLKDSYLQATTSAERAKIAAERIDRFIAEHSANA